MERLKLTVIQGNSLTEVAQVEHAGISEPWECLVPVQLDLMYIARVILYTADEQIAQGMLHALLVGWLLQGDNRGKWSLWEQPALLFCYSPVMNSTCVGMEISEEAGL